MQNGISCLVDTNIIIQFEEEDSSTGVLKEMFTDVFRLCQKYQVKLVQHPSIEEDIHRDNDEKRKAKTLSYKEKYPDLKHAPKASINELEELFGGIKSENDKVDCLQLYALHRNCTDFLITEDGGIHRRGSNCEPSLKERIFSIHEFRAWLLRHYEPNEIELPSVEKVPVYSLKKENKFFNSLREVYTTKDGFDSWFDKCCRENREALIIWGNKEAEEIAAICIYNIDTEYVGRIEEMGVKPLKLCTFKVENCYRGTKLGELLLKYILMYADENAVSSLWLTAFGGQQIHLIHFLEEFGFLLASFLNNNYEDILYKVFEPPKDLPGMSPIDFHKLYWPNYYDMSEISKYIIPVKPEFHEVLFPEISEIKEEQLTFLEDSHEKRIPGNTIKKVYLCHSPTRTIEPGSLIFFYRSEDVKAITTLGIVERVHIINDFSNAIKIVGKRSVYTLSEIQGMVEKETVIIEFRFVKHLKTTISYEDLVKGKILNGPPVSIVNISGEKYNCLTKELGS